MQGYPNVTVIPWLTYNSRQKRFGFIQYYLYINGIALAVIYRLCVNSTPLDVFHLPSSYKHINNKILCVNIRPECDVDVVSVDNVLEKCWFVGVSTDANYVCTINTVILD